MGFDDAQLSFLAAQGDELVHHIPDGWTNKVGKEHGFLHYHAGTVDDGQDIEDDEQLVGHPEQVEDVPPGGLSGKHVQDTQDEDQEDSSET